MEAGWRVCPGGAEVPELGQSFLFVEPHSTDQTIAQFCGHRAEGARSPTPPRARYSKLLPTRAFSLVALADPHDHAAVDQRLRQRVGCEHGEKTAIEVIQVVEEPIGLGARLDDDLA